MSGSFILKQKVLITGGAGFLGSHLVDKFLKEGFKVIVLDNLSTGNLSNLSHLSNNQNFEFVKHDVTKFIQIDGDLHFILHFASPASPFDYLSMPIQTMKVGSLGTHNALGLAKAKNAKFILASTSEVYGDPLIHPQREDYWGNVNPIGERGVYDEAKRFSEALTTAYYRYHNLRISIVRIFNTYGPRMRLTDGRALPAFMTQALKNDDLTIFGDGSQTRSFTYVSDLVDGIYKLTMSNYNKPMNIGNPQEISIIEFAKEVISLTGSKSQIVHKPLPVDDPKLRRPDIKLANKLLNWTPKITRYEGIMKTIPYFKKSL
jgi:dTDP-glucose 4,6-dehydratase